MEICVKLFLIKFLGAERQIKLNRNQNKLQISLNNQQLKDRRRRGYK